MVQSPTEDCFNNVWAAELLAFETARVRRLFPGWTRDQVVLHYATALVKGLVIASDNGICLGLSKDQNIHITAILGNRAFIDDVNRVWRDLYPSYTVTAQRHGRVKTIKSLWDRKKLQQVI